MNAVQQLLDESDARQKIVALWSRWQHAQDTDGTAAFDHLVGALQSIVEDPRVDASVAARIIDSVEASVSYGIVEGPGSWRHVQPTDR